MVVAEVVVAATKSSPTSTILSHLTLAALALPGLLPQSVLAGRVEESYNADFQYGHYSESGQRMSVDIFEGASSLPIGKQMTGTLNLVRDVITGASPMYNRREANGKLVQVLSGASRCGASICDERNAISSGLTYFWDATALSLGGGYSSENDYVSRYFNTALSMDFNKKLTTLNLSASVAFDENNPRYLNNDCGEYCHKTSQQYLLGISQIIDKDSLLQSNMSFAYHQGYLSDPYKLATFYTPDASYVVDPNQPGQYVQVDPVNPDNIKLGTEQNSQPILESAANDRRPRDKFQWAWLTQYVRHFGQFNDAALHVDYRFTLDNWGIRSHTQEISWHQPLVDGWQLIPRFRYYSQTQAEFYNAVFTGQASDYTYYSGDYRLAGFGALSGGLKLTKTFTALKAVHDLKLQIGAEYYDHQAGYQLEGNTSSPFADFSYYLLMASFNAKF
ncbi:MAG: DUF3570 domain-containing protein [Methylovulum sp.]|nr:DUF3570 domain-containing protein [Methylovulum sp.]MCF7999494.1 DUF3570 domain-containing protein [Methylovulum sp.]